MTCQDVGLAVFSDDPADMSILMAVRLNSDKSALNQEVNQTTQYLSFFAIDLFSPTL